MSVDNGILSMTARQESLNGRDYVSGVISTGGVADQVARDLHSNMATSKARMKLPSGKGLWPAFWMLPTVDSNGQFRDDEGEIDIVELIGDRSHVAEVHVHPTTPRTAKASMSASI